MLVYLVTWHPLKENIKGHISKVKSICFTVLCRNSSDAVSCLQYLFRQEHLNDGLILSDGEFTLTRYKLDSRNFHVDYMFMDGIKIPICLHNLKLSISKLFPSI